MPHNLHVVLVEPQIPQNVGAIGRTCLATETTLHLVDPLGFKIDDTKLKRAGLDYWQYLDVVRHRNLEAMMGSLANAAPKVFYSTKARKNYFEHRFEAESYLFFGSETQGLPEDLLTAHSSHVCCIPQYDPRVRSLNLANVVCVAVYEAIRQLGP